MKGALVTSLMPCRNVNEVWLRTAIRTSAEQTYDNYQLVICDNASTDSTTVEILKEAKDRWPERITLTQESKIGTAYALDACLKASDPDTTYYTKMDADDIAHRDREKARVRLFETLPPQIGGLYDNFLMLNYRPRPHIQPVILHPYDYRQHVNESFIHGNTMFRASVFKRNGGPVKETFVHGDYEGKSNHHGEDYFMWLAIGDYYDFFWYNCDPAMSWTYRFPGDNRSKYASDKKGVDYCRAYLQNQAKQRRGLLSPTSNG